MSQQFNINRENQGRERFLRLAWQRRMDPLQAKVPRCEQTQASQFPHQDAPLKLRESWGMGGEVDADASAHTDSVCMLRCSHTSTA